MSAVAEHLSAFGLCRYSRIMRLPWTQCETTAAAWLACADPAELVEWRLGSQPEDAPATRDLRAAVGLICEQLRARTLAVCPEHDIEACEAALTAAEAWVLTPGEPGEVSAFAHGAARLAEDRGMAAVISDPAAVRAAAAVDAIARAVGAARLAYFGGLADVRARATGSGVAARDAVRCLGAARLSAEMAVGCAVRAASSPEAERRLWCDAIRRLWPDPPWRPARAETSPAGSPRPEQSPSQSPSRLKPSC